MPLLAPLFLIVYWGSIIPCESRFWGTPNFYSTRSVIVHLDQWLYDDVQRECSEHLDKSQIAAVLVSAIKDENDRSVTLKRRGRRAKVSFASKGYFLN